MAPSLTDRRSIPPVVQRSDFAARVAELKTDDTLLAAIDSLNGPAVILLTGDQQPGRTRRLPWLVAPAKLVGNEWRWWRVRLDQRRSTHWLVTQAEPLD